DYPPRPAQHWRWLLLGMVGMSALLGTLFLLNGRGKQSGSPDQNTKDAGSPAERQKLIAGLSDTSLEVRRASAERLREFKGDDVVLALAERVGDDYWPDTRDANGSDRVEALLSLRLLNKSAIPSALEKAMVSENDRVRIWAINEIVHLAEPKTEPMLIAAL